MNAGTFFTHLTFMNRRRAADSHTASAFCAGAAIRPGTAGDVGRGGATEVVMCSGVVTAAAAGAGRGDVIEYATCGGSTVVVAVVGN